MEYAVEVKGLTKYYPGFTLDHVSFSVPSGSIVGFIGENGAGKSTTMKAVLDLIRKDDGEVWLLGKKNGAKFPEIKEQIGVVFEESYFPDNLKLADVDRMMNQIFRGWESEKYFEYCRRFQLPENKTVKTFSRGMKMKLSIAAALSHGTRLLILDEGTSGLDPVVRNEILDIFQEFIEKEDCTVFLSTHITSDIERISDYILLIHEGQILLYEEKDRILYEYGIVRCSRKQEAQIDRKQIVGIRRNQFETEILIRDRKSLQGIPDLVVDRASLEDILLFIIKNSVKEEAKKSERTVV